MGAAVTLNPNSPFLGDPIAFGRKAHRHSRGERATDGPSPAKEETSPNKRVEGESPKPKGTKGSGSGEGPKPPANRGGKTAIKKAHSKSRNGFTSWVLGIAAGGFGAAALALYTLGERIIPHDKLREGAQIVTSVGSIFFISLFGAEKFSIHKSDTGVQRRDI